MREPRFWYDRPSWQSLLLRPIGWIYGALTKARVARQPGFVADIPVICFGNINVGGTGKTPTAIAVAERLTDWGVAVHIVSRGYGGDETGPVNVDSGRHTAQQVGDEPLLLSAFASTWVSKDRAAGVKAAQEAGADVVLLDDGFQNPAVRKDVSIVVVDAQRGFGNGQVIPAGPLREPVSDGLRRADVVLTIGDAPSAELQLNGCPTTHGRLVPLQTGMTWKGLRVLAFAGIGNPSKFFATLRALGVEMIKSEPLEDHQPLTSALMNRLEAEAKSQVAQLVTTEKDAVRLPVDFRSKVLTVPVRLQIEDWSAIDQVLKQVGLQPNKS